MRARVLGLAAVVIVAGAGAWLGCGGDDTAVPTTDGGSTDGTAGGDAGGGTDSGGGKDGGGGDAAPGVVSCETYCTQVAAHCTATIPATGSAGDAGSAQYNSKDGCLAECARMTPGTIDDQSGDTVGCRQYHSGTPAATNSITHCPHAGPSGGGVCSEGATAAGRCATFCKLAVAICMPDSGTGVTSGPFTDRTDCLTKCAGFNFSTTDNELTQAGNTLNCRQYHLMAAYSGIDAGSAIVHCGHIGQTSPTCN